MALIAGLLSCFSTHEHGDNSNRKSVAVTETSRTVNTASNTCFLGRNGTETDIVDGVRGIRFTCADADYVGDTPFFSAATL